MKYAIVIAIALFAISAASASSAGQFLPRAFFTLDSEGHQSDVHPVNAHLLRRLRRQVFSSPSSSSSSSVSTGDKVIFHSQTIDASGSAGSSDTQQAASALRGQQSDVQPVNAHLLGRLRRQVTGSTSSSSSSSSSSSGNGVLFASTSHYVQNSDGSGSAGSSYTQQAAPAAVGFDSRFGEDSATGNYNAGGQNNGGYSGANTGAYNGANTGAYNGASTGANTGAYNGAYNGASTGGYNTASSINTNTGFGSTNSYQQSFGSGALPQTQIHQTVTTFDSNGNQKVTTIQGATDQSGILNVQKQETNYSGK